MASYRLAIRRDTAANWTSENPTLAQGEFGYEADTGSLKIGDGVTAWTSLGYYTSIAGADLDNLLDVDTTGAIVGDVLKWDGTNWVPALDNTYTDQEVSNHLNVGTATPLQILQWDGADFDWVDSDALTGVVDINDLGDVDTTGVVGGDVLKWNGSAWTPAADDDVDSLVDLTDTVITTPANGEVLSYNGAAWVNATAPAGYTDSDVDTHLNTSTATDGQILSYTAGDYDWIDAPSGGSGLWEDQTTYYRSSLPVVIGSATETPDDINANYTGITVAGANGGAINFTNGSSLQGRIYGNLGNQLIMRPGSSGEVKLTDTNGIERFRVDGTTGVIKVGWDSDSPYTLPAKDGDANQVLTTDGSGAATWQDAPVPEVVPESNVNPTVLLKGDVAVDQDDSLNGYTFTTTGTPTLDTGDKQFGAGSISFPTTSKITTNETINIGTGSWCFEAWMKPASVVGTEYWASKPPVGGNMWFYFNAGVPGVSWNGAGRAMTSTLSTSAWNHIAWVYDAGNTTLKGYFNGVEEFTVTGAANDLGDFVWAFGGTDSGVANSGSWYSGKIDDLRLTVGDPVYTGAFTPAEHTAPVPNPLGTDETDVTITNPVDGEVLTYNGTNWVNAAAAGGSLSWNEVDPGGGGVDSLYHLPLSTSIGVCGDGDGFFLAPGEGDFSPFTTSFRIFGSAAKTLPFYGGLVFWESESASVVTGRDGAAFAIDGASAGLNDSTKLFSVHNNLSAPKFAVSYQTGVATFNNAFSFPNGDGSAGQVLTTDGSGTVTWEDALSDTINPDTGVYVFPNLPTADPVNAGQLWNDAGTLKVSAG